MIMPLWVSTKLTHTLLMQCGIREVLKVLWKTSNNIWPYVFFFIVHVLKCNSGVGCSPENISCEKCESYSLALHSNNDVLFLNVKSSFALFSEFEKCTESSKTVLRYTLLIEVKKKADITSLCPSPYARYYNSCFN